MTKTKYTFPGGGATAFGFLAHLVHVAIRESMALMGTECCCSMAHSGSHEVPSTGASAGTITECYGSRVAVTRFGPQESRD